MQSIVFAGYDGGSTITNESDWVLYKQQQGLPSDLPLVNPTNLKFNKELWEELKLIVYGDYSIIGNNDFKQTNNGYYKKDGITGEYRYHGQDRNGNKVTNANFPNDADSGKGVEDKTWVTKPWEPNSVAYSAFTKYVKNFEGLTGVAHNVVQNINKYNGVIQASKDIDLGLSFAIKKSTSGSTLAYEHFYVQSDPTPTSSGQGIMFHKTPSGQIWYQSFPLTKLTSKLPTPVEANIPNIWVVEAKEDGTYKLKIRVTGKLLDDDIISNVDKTLQYYGEDIKKWTMTLYNDITKSTQTLTGIMTSKNTGSADFDLTLTQSQYKSLLNSNNEFTINFIGTAKAEFYTEQFAQDDAKNSRTIKGKQTENFPPTPNPTPPAECEPITACVEPILFTVNAPRMILDVDKFNLKLTENDVSKAKDRYVILDGRKLSDSEEATFLSGNWKFPEIREDRVYDYTIVYVHENAELWYFSAYVVVYDSVPHASVLINGNMKENRKITVSVDKSITTDYLESRSPIWISNFSITTQDGATIYYGTNAREFKEFLRKSTGMVYVDVSVSSNYGSRSYHYDIYISKDHEPDLISIIWNNNLVRNDSLDILSEGASLDGDTITSQKYWIYYDENKDNIPEKLVYSGDWNGSTPYKPNKLGNYKIVFQVKEEFGQPTISQHITEADKKTRTVEREFFVDNLVPMTKLYTDIEYNFPLLDVIFLTDQDLPRNENDYIRDNKTNIINNFRVNSMVANVDMWDLHTYQYTQTAYSEYHSGNYYPPSSVSYSNNGY